VTAPLPCPFLAADAARYADNDEVECIPAIWTAARCAEYDARRRQRDLPSDDHANDDLGNWRHIGEVLASVVQHLERVFADIIPNIEWLEKQIDIDPHEIVDDCISAFDIELNSDIKASIFKRVTPHLKDGFKRCGSPIEKMMLLALLITFAAYSARTNGEFLQADGFLALGNFQKLGGEVVLGQQVTLGEYRVDFLLMSRRHRIVIECDGYEFHSNKSQIQRDKSRDRWLNAHGHIVLRFTGSEIWRDPADCAAEIFDAVKSLNETPE